MFLLILVVAIFLRFYKLGSLPNGLTWDEAAIGYNAYGLITNHRDEWLHRTPIVFQSFGDFKSPLLIYLDTLPVALLGLTAFAVRLPIAVAGLGLVVTTYFIAREFISEAGELHKHSKFFLYLPHISMLLVAISPWAIHYSRMAFESMLATFLVSIGVLCWIRGRTDARVMILGNICFAFSLYAYHSAKVVVPFVVVILFFKFAKGLFSNKKAFFIGILVTGLILLPLGYASLFGKANARALGTTILGKPHAVTLFISHYLSHLRPDFLLHGKDITFRHSTKSVGVLYPLELLLFIAGVLTIIYQKKYRKFWWIPSFFFVGLIPPSLGLDVPHSNRALLALPWAQLTAILGIIGVYECTTRLGRRFQMGIWMIIIGVLCYNVINYVGIYNAVYTSSTALHELGYGYDELMAFVRPKEGGVDHVYFTDSYGQAYIYILFFKRLTPMEYQHGGLANYTISSKPYTEATGKKNVLIVGTAEDFPDSVVPVKEIYYPDGKIAFKVVTQ